METNEEQAEDLPLFVPFDLVLLTALIVVTGWCFWSNRNNENKQTRKKEYSIRTATKTSNKVFGDNSFIKKLRASGRSLVVFYGSETGTAEEFAGRIAREGTRYRLKGMLVDPENCEMEGLPDLHSIPNSLAVFCIATYGEGDPTDNAEEFFEWLQHGDVDLTGLNYAVFGLGNKTYEHYNRAAIYVDKRLEELGATRVHELGLGNDNERIEDDFINWKDNFWPAVSHYFGIEPTSENINMRQYRVVEYKEHNPDRIFTGEVVRLNSFKNQRPPFDAKNPFVAKIKVNRELHKGGNRSCMHLEFDIEGSKMRYESGDHLGVYPSNDSKLVNRIGELTNADLDIIFSLNNTDEESSRQHPFPCPCSYRTALTYYVDISVNPRTHVLHELSEYCSDPTDKEKLRLMSSSSPLGRALYKEWIIEANRSIVHLLEDIPSCKPALDHLCELLPRLQPRYYSISSSPKVFPTTIHITAVLIDYDTPTGRRNKGVATSWLALKKLREDTEVPTAPIFVRKSKFRLPIRPHTPIIMVGPGTGLAPFRAFIQERHFFKQQRKEVGETILYFGCRKKAEDFIYEDELVKYIKQGTLQVRLAFSRDQDHKVYVTHLLGNNLDEIWRVIGQSNGHFYVCGDARTMAGDVHSIVLKAIMEKGGMDKTQATAYMKKLEVQRRYSADVWS